MADLKFQAGDFVRLRLAKDEIDGTILESSDGSVYLVKLPSGYNIGIPKENVLGGRALKKNIVEAEKEFAQPTAPPIAHSKNLPKIGMVVTGGTITAKLDSRTGGVTPVAGVESIEKTYPELLKVVEIAELRAPFLIGSESMTWEHWKIIAEQVAELVNQQDIKGVIVTHGTDTLHFTSAALSFFLRNLNKPVVLTYSQRSIDRASSDAHLNLQCAAKMALSDAAEVMVVGHATMNDEHCLALRGTCVRKMHTSRRDAFKPVNCPPLARVFPDKIEFLDKYRTRHNGRTEVDSSFSDKVALVKFYPGQDASILDFYALKYKGIVVEAVGLGQITSSEVAHSWLPKLKKHIKGGLAVCITSQCVFGRVNPYVYTEARELLDAGAIFCEDIHSETAFVKLGWILGHYGWKSLVREKMLENFAGEIGNAEKVM